MVEHWVVYITMVDHKTTTTKKNRSEEDDTAETPVTVLQLCFEQPSIKRSLLRDTDGNVKTFHREREGEKSERERKKETERELRACKGDV
ncbi:hypothetical protein KIN20_003741 [Parelaphostrongylus tenuis]|uniref:Uncharacterized protein n=1 Tax=Parelaphostrongylus tenuis TaxID=148309 RepID=A0AAD5MG27_PARTN|nr:hypothetical protein KIN20_003741 [Parelaphostrongylus tenuis]